LAILGSYWSEIGVELGSNWGRIGVEDQRVSDTILVDKVVFTSWETAQGIIYEEETFTFARYYHDYEAASDLITALEAPKRKVSK